MFQKKKPGDLPRVLFYCLQARDIRRLVTGICWDSYKSSRLKRNENHFFSSGKIYGHLEATTSKNAVIFVLNLTSFKAEALLQTVHPPVGDLEVINFRTL